MKPHLLHTLALLCATATGLAQDASPRDPMRDLQLASIADRDTAQERVYAFGWQGLADVFSTHRTHSNRPVLALTFGRFASLGACTGAASPYRSAEALERIFGAVPPRTVDPTQVHLDQTQLHDLMLAAADQGARRIIVLLLDGCDWQTYAAASVVASGTWDPDGYGVGLPWFDFVPPTTRPGIAYRDAAAVVTTPRRASVAAPGFDLSRAGRFPWSPQDANYLAGDYRTARDGAGRITASFDRATTHAVVDSAASATAIFSGVKTLNGRIGTDAKGEPVLTLGRRLQARGFTIATVTDVPFDHASPGSVYASSTSRVKYHEIGRQMLGLESYDGADVVLGYGHRFGAKDEYYLRNEDLDRLGSLGRYRIVTSSDEDPRSALATAATEVARARAESAPNGFRLFGFFGDKASDHAPVRTADGRFDATPSLSSDKGELVEPPVQDAAVLRRMPDLQSMTRAALTVLDAVPERPFLLFVEAGQVDWALHQNNLDHAVGEVRSAAAAFDQLTGWVTAHGWWDETLLLVTSDHGHLLQVDLPKLRAAMHGQ